MKNQLSISSIILMALTFFTVIAAVISTTSVMAKDLPNATQAQIRQYTSTACDNGKTYKIAYSHPVSEAQIVREVRRFASERAAEIGCVEVLHDNTQHNNLEQQLNAVQGWITIGVDAIVVTPIDPSALAPLQRQAQKQGIKWLTYLGKMKGSDGFVGFNHSQSGQMVANAAVKWVKANHIKNAKALVTTLTGLPLLSPRWTEVERIFAKNGITIVAKQDSSDQTSGLKIAETVINKYPKLSIMIGLNDDSAVGMYRAAKLAGLDESKLFIAGQDGSAEGLAATNKGGAYRGSSAILINQLGANIIDQALNAINGKGPTSAYTPTVWASKANQKQLDMLIANYK